MSSDARRADGPPDLRPREAMNYYLDHRRTDAADRTIRTYQNRLRQWVRWCEENGIDRMSEFTGWHIDQYERARRAEGDAPPTMKGKLNALKLLLEYLERIEVVDDELAEKVEIPTLSKAEESNDKKLDTEDAEQLLGFYRDSTKHYGTREHAVLEVLWHTGARVGGVRALDVGDFDRDDGYLYFRHRPETGTRLKNGEDGERAVQISESVVDALDHYVTRERPDKRDENGRQPLFATRQGRAAITTLRSWSYLGTQPCVMMQCPHGDRRGTCEYVHRNHASKCPSSRSPHQIRTGSITWHCNRGLPVEVISDRVDASPDVIEDHYDKAEVLDEMVKRRSEYTSDLDLDV